MTRIYGPTPIGPIVDRVVGEKLDLTNLQALVQLYALQSFRRATDHQGRFYGPGFFSKPTPWVKHLARDGRKPILRLIGEGLCLRCSAPMSPNSVGDHVIARSRQGADSLQNYLPLCSGCNSSKGRRDFLDWWQRDARGGVLKARRAHELHKDAMVVYTRMTYQHLGNGELSADAPDYLKAAMISFRSILPTSKHWIVLRQLPLSDELPLLEVGE